MLLTIRTAVVAMIALCATTPAQYTVSPATAPFTPIANFPGAAPLLYAALCDDCTETVPLPIPIPWFGSAGNLSVIVAANGSIIFDNTNEIMCCAPFALDNGQTGGAPAHSVLIARLQVVQENLDPEGAGGGDIYVLNTGSSTIISWEAVSLSPGPNNGSVNAQAELFMNGDIEVRYGAINFMGRDFACGLTDPWMGVTLFHSPMAVIPQFNAVGQTSGGVVPQNTGCRFVPTGPLYQVNTAEASLDIDGAQGSVFLPANPVGGVGATSTLTFGSTLSGMAHDVLVSTMPLTPAGLFTPNGQIVNVTLNDPSAIFLFGATISDPIGTLGGTFAPNYSLPFTFAAPIAATTQGAIIDVSHADGVSITAPVEYAAIPCNYFEDFDALTPNTGAASASGPYPIGWFDGGGTASWQTYSGLTPSGGTGPLGGALSAPNYMYCETSVPNTSATFIMDTCPYDESVLTNNTLDFQLNRIGSSIGTLNVLVNDGAGNWTTMASYTGSVFMGGSGWTPESIDLTPYLTGSTIQFRFEYTGGGSYVGDLAIDDFSLL